MALAKRNSKRTDPVLSDQGGRMMQSDPIDSPNRSKDQEIRIRAYKRYERRGRTDGHDLQDWLDAESEIV